MGLMTESDDREHADLLLAKERAEFASRSAEVDVKNMATQCAALCRLPEHLYVDDSGAIGNRRESGWLPMTDAFAGAWAPAAHSIEPGGRVRLHSPSRLVRIAAESLPPAEVPPEVLEATRRLFGWRDQHRPTGERDTAVMLLAGGLRKSGAGELLQRSGYIVRTL